MFTPLVRLLLIAFLLIIGGIRYAQDRPLGALVAAAGVAFLTYDYFRAGTVWLAFRALRDENLPRAERFIGQVRRPQYLSPRNLAYYFWVQGALAAQRGDLGPARRQLALAFQGRLRTTNDRCVVACCLADLAIRAGDPEAARAHLGQARALRHRPALEPVIQELEALLPEN